MSSIGVGGRIARAASVGLLVLASCGRQEMRTSASALGVQGIECMRIDGRRYVGVEFKGLIEASWLSEFALYGYTYTRAGTDPPTPVEGPYPPAIGPGGARIEDPATEPRPTAAVGAPPTALIPAGEAPEGELLFSDFSLINEGEVVIEANSLGDLREKAVATPLGQASVTDVIDGPTTVELELSFDWVDPLRDHDSLQPHGSLGARMTLGDEFALSLAQAGDDGVEVFVFELPQFDVGDPVTLTLGQFEVSAQGSLSVDLGSDIC